MPRYQAQPGEEDRHGEMTGGITMNYILVMPPIMIWCMFIAPMFMGPWPNLVVAVVLSVVLTVTLRPVSQYLWAHISDSMDRSRF